MYGYNRETTLESLFLSVLPTSYQFKSMVFQDQPSASLTLIMNKDAKPEALLLQTIETALRDFAGFHMPICSDSEIENDAKHIYDMIVSNDSEFLSILHSFKSGKSIVSIVDEAFHWLYKGPPPSNKKATIEIYTDTCMVIAFIFQWLVMYFCKRLMQLVTPEALVILNQEIPRYYCKYYMECQEHFQLKKLIKMHYTKWEQNNW